MDRAHRLGQKNPVLVFRLVTANSIEAKMLERAGAKRKLEALVIGSGKYTTSLEDLQDIFTGNSSKGKSSGVGEEKAAGLAAQMFAEEMREQSQGKEIRVIKEGEEVISDAQLQALLDRSDEAMGRGKGWKVEEGEETKAIEVIETVAAGDEDGNDVSLLHSSWLLAGLTSG
jgi:ATP-dependent DNA helicase